MRKNLVSKLGEALFSVLPVLAIILVLALTPLVTLTWSEVGVFCAGAVFLIIGIALFNLGADMAMTPMGEHSAEGLTKTKKPVFLLIAAFLIGFTVTVAEPDLSVLAGQIGGVMNGTVLIVSVGAGVGVFLTIGVVKILRRHDVTPILMFFFMVLFAFSSLLAEIRGGALIPLSFDSGGVTTGPITVPFIMAFGSGIALTLGGRKADENSFGLVALCSVGPVAAVLALTLTSSGTAAYSVPDYSPDVPLMNRIGGLLGSTSLEVARSLVLIAVIFAVLQISFLRLPPRKLIQMGIGILYTFAGLVIFLVAVTVGFMPVGYKIGAEIASAGTVPLALVGFVLGTAAALAEPAVHVLNRQVENVTGGTVKRSEMLAALAVGVGISIALSLIRMALGFSLLFYLIPGYLLSLGLSFFVPKIYTAIAFDSGGVASGPLTSGFILPLAIGACVALRGEGGALQYGFGVVAMVAMTPPITIQLLGFRAVISSELRRRRAIKNIRSADDAQIIYF